MRQSTLIFALCAWAAGANAQAADCRLRAGETPATGRAGLCNFAPGSKSFDGSAAQQVTCLTRAVKMGGVIGDKTAPAHLQEIVGTAAIPLGAVEGYLTRLGLKAADLGGDIHRPVTADYFIIHDTSSPNCSEKGVSHSLCPQQGEFPPNRDDITWPVNKSFDGHPKAAPHRLAHAFTNRVGGSVTEVDFALPIVTTKFEQCSDARSKAGLFVGVENIQPRTGKPAIPSPGKMPNDLVGPSPGFPPKQYERLALLYVIASARRGHWLIPAFHAVLDQQYADGHDDPQNFDIDMFDTAISEHVRLISSPP